MDYQMLLAEREITIEQMEQQLREQFPDMDRRVIQQGLANQFIGVAPEQVLEMAKNADLNFKNGEWNPDVNHRLSSRQMLNASQYAYLIDPKLYFGKSTRISEWKRIAPEAYVEFASNLPEGHSRREEAGK